MKKPSTILQQYILEKDYRNPPVLICFGCAGDVIVTLHPQMDCGPVIILARAAIVHDAKKADHYY
jgi:hypothetical protein